MYEKHIKELTEIRHSGDDLEGNEALDAAIALMRAAEPKDEAAERRACSDAFFAMRDRGMTIEQVVAEQRFAARAEVEAKYQAMLAPKDERTRLSEAAPKDTVAIVLSRIRREWELDPVSEARCARLMIEYVAHCRRENRELPPINLSMAAARIEPEEIHVAVEKACRRHDADRAALNARLMTANARIAELVQARDYARRAMLVHEESIKMIETKLTALREAAERVCGEVTTEQGYGILRRAIEASK